MLTLQKSEGGLTFLFNFCVSSPYLSRSSLNKNKNKQKFAQTWFLDSQVTQNFKNLRSFLLDFLNQRVLNHSIDYKCRQCIKFLDGTLTLTLGNSLKFMFVII